MYDKNIHIMLLIVGNCGIREGLVIQFKPIIAKFEQPNCQWFPNRYKLNYGDSSKDCSI